MQTFRETFKLAEANSRALLANYGFSLSDLSVTEESDSQWVGGAAHYLENRRWFHMFKKRRFIRLSVAPLRLESDLDIGRGSESYSIYELHELEGDSEFPERTHDLYKAMYNEDQLQSEFERLIKVFTLCGKRFIENDDSFWLDLRNQRIRRATLMENEQIFKEAQIAFKAQRWGKVVTLLENKKQALSKLNHGRLIYAKKKMRQST